jgi:hypothetical protein
MFKMCVDERFTLASAAVPWVLLTSLFIKAVARAA